VPFDHTSIIATLRAMHHFQPLTARDAAAPSLLDVLDFGVVNDGPAALPGPRLPAPDPAVVAALAAAPPNGIQRSLAAAAQFLPVANGDLVGQVQVLAGAADRFRAFLRRA
jgi:phospholipase C